mmetsp:Transcript_5064/g.19048  ORF Transcript_5064/g.19048 Transcript_5064/m.19048 type:complete len:530 (-) Transcript_5064:851-2440(-)
MNAAILRAPGAVRVPAARTSRVSKSSRTRVGTSTCRQAKPALSMGFAPHAASHKRGSIATNTRAIALTDVLRPGAPKRIVESEQLPKEIRDPVMDSIQSLGGKCTVGDVASAAGVKLSDAENAMKAIAADTGATLEVSSQGDILYVFDRDFRSLLNAKSTKIKTVEPLLEGAGKVGGYLLRISFGTTLLASIVIVYTAIAALLSSRSSDDDRDDRRGGGGGMFFGPRMYFSPFDMFWYWDPYYYERRSYYAAMEGAKDMDFLEAVFSFVFGDGDPNADFERKRWALVGLCIQRNNGVVTAEQLAPFLDRDEHTIGTDDESFVLPALTRFNGAPEVDPASGEIVYRFEDLESTAGGVAAVQAVLDEIPRELGVTTSVAEEETYRFSLATGGQRTMAAALGVFNFVGVVALGIISSDPQIAMQNRELVAAVGSLLPGLQAYAVAFFAIPAVRWFVCQRRNAQIDARNAARLEASKQIARPGKLLKEKMDAARRLATGRRTVTEGSGVFSSGKSAADYEAEDFERRLRERNQ